MISFYHSCSGSIEHHGFLGSIAALSLFLRQAVIDFMIMMRRKRKRSIGFILQGKGSHVDTSLCILYPHSKHYVSFFKMSAYYYDDYYNYEYYDNPSPPYKSGRAGNRKGSASNRRSGGDLVAAASGGGDCCPHVVDSSLFALTFLAIPVVTYLIWQQITMNLGRRKRRKRSGSNIAQDTCERLYCDISKGKAFFMYLELKLSYL